MRKLNIKESIRQNESKSENQLHYRKIKSSKSQQHKNHKNKLKESCDMKLM